MESLSNVAEAAAQMVQSWRGQTTEGNGELEQLSRLVRETEEKRIDPGTRKGYERKLTKFMDWINAQDEQPLRNLHLVRGDLPQFLADGGEECEAAVLDYLAKRYHLDHVGHGSCSGVASALSFATKEAGTEVHVKLRQRIAGVLLSLKKEDAKKREKGELKAQVGKQPLSFTSYSQLCLSMLKEADLKGLLTVSLTWNMVNRINETIKLSYTNISSYEDHLVICVQKSKADQSGRKPKRVRVFSNPNSPHLCVFTALLLMRNFFLSVQRARTRPRG